MSSNRLIYDTCAYKHELSQSVGPLQYTLNPIKFENVNNENAKDDFIIARL